MEELPPHRVVVGTKKEVRGGASKTTMEMRFADIGHTGQHWKLHQRLNPPTTRTSELSK